MSFEFGWFPRPKYRDLVFYVKADQGMNTRLFDMPDTEDGRALMKALADPAAEIARLREENARKEAMLTIAERCIEERDEAIKRAEEAERRLAEAREAMLSLLRKYWPMGDEEQYRLAIDAAIAGKGV